MYHWHKHVSLTPRLSPTSDSVVELFREAYLPWFRGMLSTISSKRDLFVGYLLEAFLITYNRICYPQSPTGGSNLLKMFPAAKASPLPALRPLRAFIGWLAEVAYVVFLFIKSDILHIIIALVSRDVSRITRKKKLLLNHVTVAII